MFKRSVKLAASLLLILPFPAAAQTPADLFDADFRSLALEQEYSQMILDIYNRNPAFINSQAQWICQQYQQGFSKQEIMDMWRENVKGDLLTPQERVQVGGVIFTTFWRYCPRYKPY